MFLKVNAQDNSKIYYNNLVKNVDDSTEYLDEIIKNDFSQFWIKELNYGVLGFIGKNFQRIYIHFNQIIKNELNPNEYLLSGKTKVKKNICDFLGKIKILHINKIDHDIGFDPFFRGSLIAEYEFYEDSKQKHTGYFKGIFSSDFAINEEKVVTSDDYWDEIDGSSNNHFVGVWIDYISKKMTTCNLGQYGIPYSGDLDIGDVEFHPNPKYKKYGWDWNNSASSEKDWWK